MKQFLPLVAIVSIFAGTALATTTWTSPGASASLPYKTSRATTTTGSEACPTAFTTPDAGPVGLPLRGLKGLVVTVKAVAHPSDGGVQTFSGGTLEACAYNPAVGIWSRAPDLDLIVKAGLSSQTFIGLTVPMDVGNVAWMPNNVGVGVDVYVSGK